jgi:hypothetical protein
MVSVLYHTKDQVLIFRIARDELLTERGYCFKTLMLVHYWQPERH